jgi:type I restriction enzyme M protein
MDFIAKGIEMGHIAFDDDRKNINYCYQGKKRRYTDPEEQVQAQIFCRLILEYGYPNHHITINETVTLGSSTKQADILVYHDDALSQPYLVIECKQLNISEAEFKQAVLQAFAYAHALAGTTKYVWVTKGDKDEFYKFDKNTNKRVEVANIPQFGELETMPFQFVKGAVYRFHSEKVVTLHDLSKIAESDLIRTFKQAHDALWAGGELNPSQAFDELDKLIFCKIWDEKNTPKGKPYQFQIFAEELPEDLKKRIDLLYEQGKLQDAEVFNKPIDLTPERMQTVVRYLQKINLTKTDLDSKGKAFETFLGTYFRGEFGQYFTPRAVVKMMIDALPISNLSKVLDTSCGSGGFLLYALEKVRAKAAKNYVNYIDDPDDRESWKRYWHDFAEKRLFGIEINEQIARVAKMNMIINDDGHTNVIACDGLYPIDFILNQTKNKGFTANSFDFIVTNPPFGSIIKQSEKSYLQVDKATAPYYDFALKEVNWIEAAAKGKHATTGRENQSTEVLFIEQCHKFLKAGGYLAVVIPDGILTNSSLQYVRDDIERKFQIVAVVSLPQTTFTHTGAGVKSSVLFLKKHTQAMTDSIKTMQDDLKQAILNEKKVAKTFQQWETDKKNALKPLAKAKDDAAQAQKDGINEAFAEKWNALQDELAETFQQRKQTALPNYPILMAMAEHIGYDATGKPTQLNDLPEISQTIERFITNLEKGILANFQLPPL